MATTLRVGRYEALRPIASGGMATVYLGRAEGARGFERQVAIKAMHPHLAEDPEFVTMFLDEARMAANIRHPNVVPTLDVAEENGQLFLVMEYVEGLSLQALMRALRKKRVSLPLPIALRMMLDMLAGLEAAHELTSNDGTPMNLVHRDVSPHNVLVGTDGVSRIMDFGIARAEMRVSSTRGAEIKGKIPYMSPEQVQAKRVDRRSDIYAAGIVMWETLTGEGLFRADNQGALVNLVLAGASRPPSAVSSEIPLEIDAVCVRALGRAPEERYQTATEFAEALEDAAARARVTIATSRVVGAFVKDAPSSSPSRFPEAIQPPSSQPPPSSLDPSSLSNKAEIAPTLVAVGGASEIRKGVDASPPPPPPNGRALGVAAALAASLVVGGLIWFFTRPSSPPELRAPSASPAPSASAALVAEVVHPPPSAPLSSAAPPPTARASAAALTAPSAVPSVKPAVDSVQRTGKPPVPKSTATAFRPEEP